MKIGDKVRTTDKYNATLTSNTKWARIDLGEIIDFSPNGNVAHIKMIKSKNRNAVDYMGINYIEVVSTK